MSLIEAKPGSRVERSGDAAAIAHLHRAFNVQQTAFARDRDPSLAERRGRIEALMGMVAANRARISDALSADFGSHPVGAGELLEVVGVLGRAQYVLAHLENWMRADPRPLDAAVMGSATASMRYQPKGVIGNMIPWNFPFDIGLGPAIEMLAAGNRVILKPSDMTPACAALTAEMVATAFDPDLIDVVVGGLDLAREFPVIRWDHLLYTGSPGVGRQVMAAAAQNLTPVTLELGGKCPAILAPGAVSERNVEAVIGTKMIKNGQMCVTVDHCFVARSEVDRFVELAQAFMQHAAPDYSHGPDCAGIISSRHLERLTGMLAEAEDRQARIIQLEQDGAIDPLTRRMPMSLVIDPPADLALMRDEIFGPLLPIIPYDNLDAAVSSINAGDRPLGLYVFADDPEIAEAVLRSTSSGGACVNACALQGALPSLGFGGSGTSGMGRHHGIEGFREFSNHRGVVVRGERDMIDAFYAPYAKASAIVDALLS